MRASGVCSVVYGLVVGFPEDEIPMTNKQLQHVNILVSCFLSSLDLAEEQDFEPVVYRYSGSFRKVFLRQVRFYSDDQLPASVQILRQISLIAKAFKLYRMSVAQEDRNFTKDELKVSKKISTMRMTRPASYQRAQILDLVKELHHESRSHSSYLPISVCFCSSFLYGQVFECPLFCFNDVTSEQDLNALKSHHQCFSEYRMKVEFSRSNDNSKAHIVMNILLVTFCFLWR